MNLMEQHYMKILKMCGNLTGQDQEHPVTVQRLAEELCCTPRNVKFILRKLEETDYIRWKAGKGRGCTSRITLLRGLDELVEGQFRAYLQDGKVREAVELMLNPALSPFLQDKLRNMLDREFGLQTLEQDAAGPEILRITYNRQLNIMDPARVFTAIETSLLGQLCNTLIVYDSATRGFLSSLSHTWEYQEEDQSWVFYLRKDVHFHHGRTLAAEDVVFTFNRLRGHHSPALWQFADVECVEARGRWTVIFYLRRPNTFFLHSVASVHMSILPVGTNLNEHPVIGTGPFRIAEQTEHLIVLEAFSDHFRERPLLDRVELLFVPNERSNVRNYSLPQTNTPVAEEQQASSELDYAVTGCRYLLFNMTRKGIQQQHPFREAMRILYNQHALIRELRGNRLLAASSLLPEKSRILPIPDRPLDEIAPLLNKAGYTGEALSLYFLPKKDETDEAHWLQQRCASVGVELTLHPIHRIDPLMFRKEADMILAEEVLETDVEWGLINFYLNPENYLNLLLQDEQKKTVSALLGGFSEMHSEEREERIDQLEHRVRQEYWLLHGCHVNKKSRLHPSLRGLQVESFGFVDISKIWIKPSSV
ncbi:ABC transporter substrate-binding protein [Paenibacillus sp. P96]|uniref:ABC transporter substrate-binding protein n=1 Tax=Paenibacillus zeirhizosphaerae TaxID=2987519 RepID=A0ABT9FRE8_9BACL|nr:ABC transporter substrate-binding protein [Paenibacillus sp. P96]MDP4097309.1 ABC transporter substrate-binding protein [Paenibacillus sp. P96]